MPDTPDRSHCWHPVPGASGMTTTAMPGMNSGSERWQCCWCGKLMLRQWHETLRPKPGHGPKAAELVIVYAPDTDTCPEAP